MSKLQSIVDRGDAGDLILDEDQVYPQALSRGHSVSSFFGNFNRSTSAFVAPNKSSREDSSLSPLFRKGESRRD